jgi:hypothetical protein
MPILTPFTPDGVIRFAAAGSVSAGAAALPIATAPAAKIKVGTTMPAKRSVRTRCKLPRLPVALTAGLTDGYGHSHSLAYGLGIFTLRPAGVGAKARNWRVRRRHEQGSPV